MRTGASAHHEGTVRERMARSGRRMLQVCRGTPVQYEQTSQGTSNRAREEDAANVYGWTSTL